MAHGEQSCERQFARAAPGVPLQSPASLSTGEGRMEWLARCGSSPETSSLSRQTDFPSFGGPACGQANGYPLHRCTKSLLLDTVEGETGIIILERFYIASNILRMRNQTEEDFQCYDLSQVIETGSRKQN